MVIIYTESSNLRSRKAVEWLKMNNIDYFEVRVNRHPFNLKDLKNLLKYTENGLDDLLSRSGQNAELNELSLEEALTIIIRNPNFLKKPILFDGKTVQSGFNDSEIRVFIPRSQREKYVGLL
ncbi:ArsC/Spx/MgsR family protein (plasmid) [Enterococcus sp. 22-H-5-01]|uniref:ArsC/Spx/MgsR family protein n=1 Tax=Enterococcus sp. 22-H-5-01 TaxID=3418555 RepID=UPI003CFFF095